MCPHAPDDQKFCRTTKYCKNVCKVVCRTTNFLENIKLSISSVTVQATPTIPPRNCMHCVAILHNHHNFPNSHCQMWVALKHNSALYILTTRPAQYTAELPFFVQATYMYVVLMSQHWCFASRFLI